MKVSEVFKPQMHRHKWLTVLSSVSPATVAVTLWTNQQSDVTALWELCCQLSSEYDFFFHFVPYLIIFLNPLIKKKKKFCSGSRHSHRAYLTQIDFGAQLSNVNM